MENARKAAGLSQVEASRKFGAYLNFICKVEQGERRIDMVEFADLCSLYGVRVETLLRKAGIRQP